MCPLLFHTHFLHPLLLTAPTPCLPLYIPRPLTLPLLHQTLPLPRHKKVKLRVLKFYKVDDSGKVQRLRKVCPQCGPGIFMATHFNRVYCGKCHLVSAAT